MVFIHTTGKGKKTMDNEVFGDQSNCARCGRVLKDELSVERGFGPVCVLFKARSIHGASRAR